MQSTREQHVRSLLVPFLIEPHLDSIAPPSAAGPRAAADLRGLSRECREAARSARSPQGVSCKSLSLCADFMRLPSCWYTQGRMSAGCTGERTRNCIQAGEYVAVCSYPRCLLHMPLWRVLLPIVSGIFTSAAGSFRDLGRCQPAGLVLRRAGIHCRCRGWPG